MGGGLCKNSHSSFQQNLKPLCTRIIAFTVLFAVIQKQNETPSENNHIMKLIKRKTETAYLKITTIIQYIIILLDIFFT